MVWAISLQSNRIARIALAPMPCAIWHIRITATCRDSASIWVYWVTSPPPSDRKLAAMLEPKFWLRTVRPNTSPKTWVTSWPGKSFIVDDQHGVRRPRGYDARRGRVLLRVVLLLVALLGEPLLRVAALLVALLLRVTLLGIGLLLVRLLREGLVHDPNPAAGAVRRGRARRATRRVSAPRGSGPPRPRRRDPRPRPARTAPGSRRGPRPPAPRSPARGPAAASSRC